MNMYLQFMSLFLTETAHVAEILNFFSIKFAMNK